MAVVVGSLAAAESGRPRAGGAHETVRPAADDFANGRAAISRAANVTAIVSSGSSHPDG